MTRPSFTMSVCHATSLSVIPTAPTVCQSTHQSVALSVHPMASLSAIPTNLSSKQSIHPPITPSKTHQSTTPPVCPAGHPSGRPSPSDCLYTILPRLSGCPTSSDHTSTIYTSPSDHPPPSHHLYDTPISPSACPSPPNCLTATTTHLPIRTSSPTIHHTQNSIHSLAVVNGEQSNMIHCTQDSSQFLAVVNGAQSHKAKKFHRAFANYDLLLCALDASSIYQRESRHVAPLKSREDANVTCDKCDFGGATLNNPSLGISYMLPRLWDPGGVRPSPNIPRDPSRA